MMAIRRGGMANSKLSFGAGCGWRKRLVRESSTGDLSIGRTSAGLGAATGDDVGHVDELVDGVAVRQRVDAVGQLAEVRTEIFIEEDAERIDRRNLGIKGRVVPVREEICIQYACLEP